MPSPWPEPLPQPIGKALRETPYRYRAIFLTVIDVQTSDFCAAEPVCFFQYRVEDGCKLTGRAVDNLQYLGGRGLLLQCLARFGQEPGVLDSDRGLAGEARNQRQLLFG